MKKEEFLKLVRVCDLAMTKDGEIYIAIANKNGCVFVNENGTANIEDIIEVRRAKFIGYANDLAWKQATPIVWKKEQKKSVFLGVSFNASPTGVEAARSYFEKKGYEVIEYDPSMSIEDNYKVITKCDEYVAVPPSDFSNTHIIGKGLYSQITHVFNGGKKTPFIMTPNCSLLPVRKLYKLEGDHNVTYALVTFS